MGNIHVRNSYNLNRNRCGLQKTPEGFPSQAIGLFNCLTASVRSEE